MSKHSFLRLALAFTLLALIAGFFAWGGSAWLSLERIHQHLASWRALLDAHYFSGVLVYFTLYVLATALSLPGATLLTLLGGALFGLVAGTVIISLASTLGATLAFLSARYLLRASIERRFSKAMQTVNAGLAQEGRSYLFGLRLVPLFPFFVVNLVMGLTRMRVSTYAWVSQLAMLPATLVYVNAGQQLGSLHSLSGIVSPLMLLSFVLLAALPLSSSILLRRWRLRTRLAPWRKPASFDINLVVIGGGAAGLVASYIAAKAGARVALIEAKALGGDCLNTGCVPSKALIRSAKLAHEARHAADYGLSGNLHVPFRDVMARVKRIIARIEPHDSAARYTALGVECISGHARIISPWQVKVGERTLSTRAIIIATGAQPAIPAIDGLADCAPLTSDTLWSLTDLPEHLLVIGGGAIGCELSQAFARLGSKVTLLEAGTQLLPRDDNDAALAIQAALRADGVNVVCQASLLHFSCDAEGKMLRYSHQGQEQQLSFDQVLLATGRKPRLSGFGLEELGLLDEGKLTLDTALATRIPHIFACGDVAGPYQFTHMAAQQGWIAAVNALQGLRRFKADTSLVPVSVFTSPELARIGLTENEALAQGIAYETTRLDLAELDRAIADEANHGFIKVLTAKGSDRILGVSIVAERGADMLAEWTLAMKHNLGLKKVLATIHAYPTWMEGNKAVAGLWQQDHTPAWALGLARRFLQRARK
ncbi:FAD-dependent oxidoreductase [Craterilacuibacter sp.]|uniref:FAD-dependent oxidoreductase n=1 Tax=Craterilacuibacter sp. TaxID=2870909 RepID=UPI003F32D598